MFRKTFGRRQRFGESPLWAAALNICDGRQTQLGLEATTNTAADATKRTEVKLKLKLEDEKRASQLWCGKADDDAHDS